MAPHSSTLAWKILWMEEPGWAAVHGVVKSHTRLSDFTFAFHLHALEKEMATHSSVLAWRIPRMVGPGGLPSMGSHRVTHDWSDLAAAAAVFTRNCLVLILIVFKCLLFLKPAKIPFLKINVYYTSLLFTLFLDVEFLVQKVRHFRYLKQLPDCPLMRWFHCGHLQFKSFPIS